MTLPSAGPLSIRDIATESGRANNLGAFYSAFPGIPASGSISISQFYGKSATFTLNIVAAVASPNIRQLAMNAGWDQSAKLIVNVNADINTLRLDAGLSFPQGVRLNISAGVRVGGVRNGGTALFTRVPVEINNLGTISGGGGAGGAGESVYFEQAGQGSSSRVWCGGGTGGDGTGYVNTASLAVTSSSGAVATTYSYTGDVVGHSGVGARWNWRQWRWLGRKRFIWAIQYSVRRRLCERWDVGCGPSWSHGWRIRGWQQLCDLVDAGRPHGHCGLTLSTLPSTRFGGFSFKGEQK